jgi:hypothetical protein
MTGPTYAGCPEVTLMIFTKVSNFFFVIPLLIIHQLFRAFLFVVAIKTVEPTRRFHSEY